jgi:DNA (cytosine-5)-methyltransferase 1
MVGFHVTGVDLKPQPRYCGDAFIQGDALGIALSEIHLFDFVWASPPCQAHVSLRSMHNARRHKDLIPATRRLLRAAGVPYAIENVVGAPLIAPVRLCGTMFDCCSPGVAELHRHRLVEASFSLGAPRCRHGELPVIGVYGGHYRDRRRHGGKSRERPDFTARDGRMAMGIWWMTGNELSQAVPPAYSKFVVEEWLKSLQVAEERVEVAS